MRQARSYVEAAALARAVLAQAAPMSLSILERRVLEAVVAHTALWSLTGDWVGIRQLAAFVYGPNGDGDQNGFRRQRVAAALRKLRKHELISYEIRRGPNQRAFVALGTPEVRARIAPLLVESNGAISSEKRRDLAPSNGATTGPLRELIRELIRARGRGANALHEQNRAQIERVAALLDLEDEEQQ